MAQILADELGVPLEWITVFHGTTSFVAEGYGTYHSRAVVVGGSAVNATTAETTTVREKRCPSVATVMTPPCGPICRRFAAIREQRAGGRGAVTVGQRLERHGPSLPRGVT